MTASPPQTIECFTGGDPSARLAALLGGLRDAPADRVAWWVAPDRFAAADAQRRIALELGPRLGWRVATLGQLAAAVCRWSPTPIRLLSATQQRGLVAEALAAARGRLQVVAAQPELPIGAGMIDFVASQLGHLAHGKPMGDLAPFEQLRWADLRLVEAEYQRLLKRGRLADDAGGLRAAASIVASYVTAGGGAGATVGLLPETLAVDLDGAWSPLEQRLLTALVQHAQRVRVVMPTPIDGEGWRRWLEGPARPVSEIAIAADSIALGGADGPRRVVRERLFAYADQAPTTHVAPEGAANVYRVLPAAGQEDHWRRIAEGVKQRLVEGAYAAEEVVIAAPNLRAVHAPASAALADAGVPYAIDRRPRLAESGLFASLLRLLRLCRDDWPHETLLDVVTDPLLGGFDGDFDGEDVAIDAGLRLAGPRAVCEWAVRRGGVLRGRERLLRLLTGIAERTTEGAPTEGDSDRFPRVAPAAAAALGRLAEALAEFAVPATPLDWLGRCRRMLSALGARSGDDPLGGLALETLGRLLADAENLSVWLGRDPPMWGGAEIVDQLDDWGTRVAISAPRSEAGRVRVVAYETAARMAPRLMVVAGAGEDSFRHAGGAAGARRLFLELATASTQETWYAYDAQNGRGETLASSPLLEELEALFHPIDLRTPITSDTAPRSRTAARLSAVRAGALGDAAPLAALLRSDTLGAGAASLCDALEVGHARATGESFGPFEGVVAGPAAAAQLAKDFNSERCWSASQLETYAACPFKFFAKHVLGAEPLETPLLELDAARRGALLHDAMVRLHAGEQQGLLLESDEALIAAFERAVREALGAMSVSASERVLADIEARQAGQWAAPYADQLRTYKQLSAGLTEPLRPTHFEVQFGPSRGAPPQVESAIAREAPFVLKVGDEELLLAGRIDRIDVGKLGEQTVFAIIDYKTGDSVRPRRGDVESGRQAQLVLYTLAAQHHLLADADAAPLLAGYWLVKKAGFKHETKPYKGDATNAIALAPFRVEAGALAPDADWPSIEAAVRGAVAASVAALRRGEFPMFNPDEDCTKHCEYATICRVGQTRSLGKLPPAALKEDA